MPAEQLSFFESLRLKQRLLGFLVWILHTCLRITWRVTLIEPESLKTRLRAKETVLFAHWHGDELVLVYLIKPYRITTLVSSSKDGAIMATVVRLIGGRTVRGSSTRGAISGTLGLVKALRQQRRNCSFAVDGPKGPLHQAKSGIFEISRLLKAAPIFPGGVYCDRAWRFPKSWNQTFLPKPFAHVVIVWGEPIFVSENEDPRSEKLRLQLENALHNSREIARKKIAAFDPSVLA